MKDLVQNLSLTLRSFARQPGMVAVIVLTLALGIGASTALFAYLAAITWPQIDAPEADRVVWVYVGTDEGPRYPASYPDFQDLRRQQTAVVDLSGFSPFGSSVRHGQITTFAWGEMVSGSYFSFFGTRPELGRLLSPADDRPGAEPVMVASHFFWKNVLGADPAVIGRTLRLNGETFTLVGVAPESFRAYGHIAAIYVPFAQGDRVTGLARLADRERAVVSQLGRLAPGVSFEQAQQALRLAGRSLDAAAPLSTGKRKMSLALATRYDELDDVSGSYLDAARVLMAAALLFLLLTSASVANLLLARATGRQREWGIRASLGASRRQLLSVVLSESTVLCLAGGLLGLFFAALIAHRIDKFLLTSPGGLGGWSDGDQLVRLDPRTFAFGLTISLVCGVLCGLAPVLRILRGDVLGALKTDATGSAGEPASRLSPRKLLVIAQVGLSVLLLLGGSLLVRTLRAAEHVDLGFDPSRLLTVSLFVPRSVGTAEEGAARVYQRVVEQAEQVPGVESATLTYAVPLAGFGQSTQVTARERPNRPVESLYNLVSPGYFEAFGLPALQGRVLGERDRRDSPPAVVVSEDLAKKLWGTESAVGRYLDIPFPEPRPGEPGTVFEVVGVVRAARLASPVEPPQPILFLPISQRAHSRLTLIVRTAGTASPTSLAPALRQAALAAHPDVALVDVVSSEEQIRRGLARQRMHAEIAGLFGLLGLGVSVVGLFGLLSYTVSLKVREMGIRMAIGARRRDVELLVLRQGMGLAAAGLLLGLAGALGLTRLLAGLLFGVGTTDPATFAAVSVGMILISLLACYLPARRAAQLDPLEALRNR